MLQRFKQVFNGNEKLAPEPERILGRHLARELTEEELAEVAGAECCPTWNNGCDCYA